MSFLFTSKFLKRRQYVFLTIKALLGSAVICFLAFLCLKATHIIFLRYSFKHFLTQIKATQNIEHNEDYNIEYSFFQSKIKVNHLVTTKDVMEVVLPEFQAQTSGGFVLPDRILLELKSVIVKEIGGNSSTLYNENQEPIIVELFLNKRIFKLPKVYAIKADNRLKLQIFNEENDISGQLTLDDFSFGADDDKHSLYMKNKGTLLLYKPSFVDYFISANRPFTWDIEFAMLGNYETWGIKDEHKAIVYEVEVKHGLLDFDFTKIDCYGGFTFDGNVRKMDMSVNINNEKKLLEAMINSTIQHKTLDIKILKQMHKDMNNIIIPKLRKNSDKKYDKHNLSLHITKTIEDEVYVNNISASEIAGSFNFK